MDRLLGTPGRARISRKAVIMPLHDPQPSSAPTPARRTVLTGAAALTAAGFVAQPAPALAHGGHHGGHHGRHSTRLTVLGTTDLHGNVFNWDYFKNLEFDNAAHDDIGIAKAATLIKAARAKLGRQPVLTLDAGDTIQGTPLAYYYARIEPIGGGAPSTRWPTR